MARPVFKKFHKENGHIWTVKVPLSYLGNPPEINRPFRVYNRFGGYTDVVLRDLIQNDSAGAFYTFSPRNDHNRPLLVVTTGGEIGTIHEENDSSFFGVNPVWNYVYRARSGKPTKLVSLEFINYMAANKKVTDKDLLTVYRYVVAEQIMAVNYPVLVSHSMDSIVETGEYFVRLGLGIANKIVLVGSNHPIYSGTMKERQIEDSGDDNGRRIIEVSSKNMLEGIGNLDLALRFLDSDAAKPGVWFSLHNFIGNNWKPTIHRCTPGTWGLLEAKENGFSRLINKETYVEDYYKHRP